MKSLIISYGSIGKRHFNILKSLQLFSEIHLVSNQLLEDIKTFNSIQEAFKLNKYDYIVIASPTNRHLEELKQILNFSNQAKILIEKPLFHKFEEIEFTNKSNIFIGYNLRFHPVIVELKNLLIKTDEVYYVNFHAAQYLPFWRPERDYRLSYSSKIEGGGVLLDLSHEIDLLHYLFGEISKCNSLVTHRSNLEIETDDITLIQGYTKKNVIFSISLDYISKMPIRQFLIQTNQQTIFADLINSKIIKTDKNGQSKEILIPKEDRNFSHAIIHTNILSNNISQICSFEEGIRVNFWIDQIKEKSINMDLSNE